IITVWRIINRSGSYVFPYGLLSDHHYVDVWIQAVDDRLTRGCGTCTGQYEKPADPQRIQWLRSGHVQIIIEQIDFVHKIHRLIQVIVLVILMIRDEILNSIIGIKHIGQHDCRYYSTSVIV